MQPVAAANAVASAEEFGMVPQSPPPRSRSVSRGAAEPVATTPTPATAVGVAATPARVPSDPAEPTKGRVGTGRKPKRPRREEVAPPSDDDACAANGADADVAEPSAKKGNAASRREEKEPFMRKALAAAWREQANGERREARERLCRDVRRLGRFRRTLLSCGTAGSEREAAVQWEGGEEAELIDVLRARINEQRTFVDRQRKTLNVKKFPAVGDNSAENANMSQEEIEDEILEQRELCCSKLFAANRDEADLKDREQRLRIEREEHLRQSRVVDAEDHLCFGHFPVLNGRYQLMRLLSRSSSVMVYKASDLTLFHSTTVRIHVLDPKMEDKQAKIRSACQECEALRELKHRGLIGLQDYFPHESASFGTVWDYIDGSMLDVYLRRNGPLPEKEARCIVFQLLSALRFIEAKGLRIQGHDLRCSRITVRAGEVKLSGAALLGQFRRNAPGSDGTRGIGDGQHHRSLGADALNADDDLLGDCWSASAIRALGVSLHEMLYNRAPEVHGGEASLVAHMVGSTVQLPDSPKISDQCREFLLRILDRDHRMSLQEASADPFVAPPPRGTGHRR